MQLMIVHKLSLAAVILVLFTAALVGGLFYTKTTDILVDQVVEDLAVKIRNTGRLLQSDVDVLKYDVSLLISTPPVQGLLRAEKSVSLFDKQGGSSYQQWRRRLESIFKAMLSNKRGYLNIRLIGKNGQEKIVVSRHTGQVSSLDKDKLQNKTHRDYTSKTLKLSKEGVYISEFDLNQEYGKIEVPHRQVLRVSRPIYDELSDDVSGFIIITVEMKDRLNELQRLVQSKTSEIYITNDRGGFLLHPDNSKSYGFSLGRRYRIQETFPRLAGLFVPENKQTEIVLLPKDTGAKNIVNFIKIPFDSDNADRFIAVGISELYSNISAKATGVLNDVLRLSLLMAVVVMMLAVLLSYRITAPIKKIIQIMDDYTHKRASNDVIPVNQNDEIGLLARSFGVLISQVEEAQASLLDMNSHLEFRVQQRTVDLNAARVDAEKANVAKSEFLSRMSHELRTPMNAILGFAQVLELDADSFTETQKSNVREILDAGQHLLMLINEVLDLAKIESGEMEIQLEKVNLSEVLQQCISLIQNQADELNLKVIDHISDKNYAVLADFIRLKQVLLNIIANAVKYNIKHGQIVLQADVMDDQILCISITDTGAGLAEDEKDRLFTPFDRLDAINNVEGTGIGLVITKHLIELMGGAIGVNSAPGDGSTFWVEIALFNES